MGLAMNTDDVSQAGGEALSSGGLLQAVSLELDAFSICWRQICRLSQYILTDDRCGENSRRVPSTQDIGTILNWA